jgi:hypothetical protein
MSQIWMLPFARPAAMTRPSWLKRAAVTATRPGLGRLGFTTVFCFTSPVSHRRSVPSSLAVSAVFLISH